LRRALQYKQDYKEHDSPRRTPALHDYSPVPVRFIAWGIV